MNEEGDSDATLDVSDVRCPVCGMPRNVRCSTSSGLWHWERMIKAMRLRKLRVVDDEKGTTT